MNWHSYLQQKTRTPAFLWRMVLGIVMVGMFAGFAAQQFRGEETAGPDASTEVESSWDQLEKLAQQGEWSALWWKIPRVIYSRTHVGPLVLAAITGCCWLVFLLQAVQAGSPLGWRFGGSLLAVALGVLSIWPTFFFILWQEIDWGLLESRDLGPGLRYFVLGVGLREELAKLLCLLPIMPLLVWKRSELAALLISSCVGLGFAMEENIGYFTRTAGTSTLGRLLTANPLHIALTGLIGLALYRAIRDPRNWGSHAVATFGLMVFAHGLYNAAIILPTFAELAPLSMIVFALIIYQFFRELRTLRTAQGETISLSATFLCGISLVIAATFVYLSATLGCRAALNTLTTDVLGLAIMVYLFLREMPESMIRV